MRSSARIVNVSESETLSGALAVSVTSPAVSAESSNSVAVLPAGIVTIAGKLAAPVPDAESVT